MGSDNFRAVWKPRIPRKGAGDLSVPSCGIRRAPQPTTAAEEQDPARGTILISEPLARSPAALKSKLSHGQCWPNPGLCLSEGPPAACAPPVSHPEHPLLGEGVRAPGHGAGGLSAGPPHPHPPLLSGGMPSPRTTPGEGRCSVGFGTPPRAGVSCSPAPGRSRWEPGVRRRALGSQQRGQPLGAACEARGEISSEQEENGKRWKLKGPHGIKRGA